MGLALSLPMVSWFLKPLLSVSLLVLLINTRPGFAQNGPPVDPIPQSLRLEARNLDPAETELALDSLRGILQELSEVRVFMVEAPGTGHQMANIKVMRRLRELGFTGRIELIYSDSAARQLTFLIPGFEAWKKNEWQHIQSPTLGVVDIISANDFSQLQNVKKLPLAISAASDVPLRRGHVKALHVECLIQLQPRNWAHRRAQRLVFFENDRVYDLHYLERFGTQTQAPATESVQDWQLLTQSLQNGQKFFQELGPRLAGLDVMPAYSLDFPGDPLVTAARITQALLQAQQEAPSIFKKPIVIPVFTPFPDRGRRQALDQQLISQGIQVIEATRRNAVNKLEQLRPGQILWIHIGPAPPDLFEAIVMHATLPVILEGKNLTQLALNHGLSFLNVIGSQADIDTELKQARLSPEVLEKLRAAFRAFDDKVSQFGPTEQKAIADYIVELRTPGSALQTFFKNQKSEVRSLNQDLLGQALLEWRDARARTQDQPVYVRGGTLPQPVPTLPRGVRRCHQVHALQF